MACRLAAGTVATAWERQARFGEDQLPSLIAP